MDGVDEYQERMAWRGCGRITNTNDQGQWCLREAKTGGKRERHGALYCGKKQVTLCLDESEQCRTAICPEARAGMRRIEVEKDSWNAN